MSIPDDELIEMLVEEDEELGELVRQHRKYEAALDKLNQRRYLSDAEQQEVARIKKRKLRGKDRIHRILDGWRKEHEAH